MSDPTDPMRAYVRAALAVQGFEFTEERIAAITLQFARFESVARTILSDAASASAAPDSGTAPVFRP